MMMRTTTWTTWTTNERCFCKLTSSSIIIHFVDVLLPQAPHIVICSNEMLLISYDIVCLPLCPFINISYDRFVALVCGHCFPSVCYMHLVYCVNVCTLSCYTWYPLFSVRYPFLSSQDTHRHRNLWDMMLVYRLPLEA